MDKMWIKCKHNHPIIERKKKTLTNSKTEHRQSCKQGTAKQETPGKIDLKSLGRLRDLSFPQLGSFMPFPFIQTVLQHKDKTGEKA